MNKPIWHDRDSLDAKGCLVIPGLHDHHTHFRAWCAALNSVMCGPPAASTEQQLVSVLNDPSTPPTNGSEPAHPLWLRGYGFHESIGVTLNRQWLDKHGPNRPVRIQHRTGRLWILNTLALERLIDTATSQNQKALAMLLQRSDDGCLYDLDQRLRSLTQATQQELPIAWASAQLAAFGITGFTDMTPDNDLHTAQTFRRWQRQQKLQQHVLMAGNLTLRPEQSTQAQSTQDGGQHPRQPSLRYGAYKVHLHETDLPEMTELVAAMNEAQDQGRSVAVHCVTEAELAFTLSAFHQLKPRYAHPHIRHRIEHASVTPPALMEDIRRLGLVIVTQPNFVYERGDAYLHDIDDEQQSWLYRTASFAEQDVPIAAGTDAPFGSADPWIAIIAAMQRKTANGKTLGATEALAAPDALALFFGEAEQPEIMREVVAGTAADLCILDVNQQTLETTLATQRTIMPPVAVTLRSGSIIYDGVSSI